MLAGRKSMALRALHIRDVGAPLGRLGGLGERSQGRESVDSLHLTNGSDGIRRVGVNGGRMCSPGASEVACLVAGLQQVQRVGLRVG